MCRLTGGAQRLFARGGPPGWQTVEEEPDHDQPPSPLSFLHSWNSCGGSTCLYTWKYHSNIKEFNLEYEYFVKFLQWGQESVQCICIFTGKFGYVSSMRSFRFCYINSRRLCKWNLLYVLKIFHIFTRRKINRKIQVLRQDKFAIDIDDRYTWKYLEHYFKKIT